MQNRTGWKMASSATPADPNNVIISSKSKHRVGGLPEPRSLAYPDSFLNSFVAEPPAACITRGAIENFSSIMEKSKSTIENRSDGFLYSVLHWKEKSPQKNENPF